MIPGQELGCADRIRFRGPAFRQRHTTEPPASASPRNLTLRIGRTANQSDPHCDMFLQYYHLREQPFGVTPDPRYLYPSLAHREALASLVYSFESELGFASLIAEPGLGKTTLLYSLLERFGPDTRNAYIFETQCDSRELLRHILSDLDCDTSETDMNALFRSFRDLVAEGRRTGRRTLIIIDEAQNLSEPVLETVRLLSNFETSSSKLVHIVLAGQPLLAQMLAQREMAQLRQRITTAARLRTFSENEVIEYINHRLKVAGYGGGPLFTPDALALITQQSGGNPREINRICFNSMSLGFALDRRTIGAELVQEAGADLDLGPVLATGAPRMLSPEPRPPRAPIAPRAAMAPVLPDERKRLNSRPAATRIEPLRQSVPPFVPPPVAQASAALRAEPAKAPPEPPLPLPQPAACDTGRRDRATQAGHRLHIPVLKAQDRTRVKQAAIAGALLLVLLAGAVAFGGHLRSAVRSRAANPVETPTDQANTTSLAPASQSVLLQPAEIPAPRNPLPRPPNPSDSVAANTAAAQQYSIPGETGGPPKAMELAPSRSASRTVAEDFPPVAPPGMTVGADSIASVPALPVKPADVPVGPQADDATASVARRAATEELSPGRLLTRVEPRYPAEALEAHIQGSVVLSAHIGKDGRVSAVRTLEGNSLLAAAAADAVRRWVYTPYTLNGQAVEVDTKIVVKFAL